MSAWRSLKKMSNYRTMRKGLIGVIVPVYKTEAYIAECIESILAQTYTNFRLILIDDGSPDNAGKICDEYAKKDNRITVIHQENAGVTRARARGVEEANDCEWITFVDSDDTLTEDALSILIANAENHECVCGNIILHNKSKASNLYNISGCFEYNTIIPSILKFERNFSWELCGKLIKKELLNTRTLDVSKEIKVFEDYIITLRYLKKTSSVRYLNATIYNYKIRENNTTSNFQISLEDVICLSNIIDKETPREFLHENFKGKCQMLGWILGDNELNKDCNWFINIVKESCNYKLCNTEKILIFLVKHIYNGKARLFIWNCLLNIKKLVKNTRKQI